MVDGRGWEFRFTECGPQDEVKPGGYYRDGGQTQMVEDGEKDLGVVEGGVVDDVFMQLVELLLEL